MSTSYKVTAEYVTLRTNNDLGQEVLLGFYRGATLPESVNEEDLDRHVRKGMVAKEGSPEAEAATPFGPPVEFDERGLPLSERDRLARNKERAEAQRRPRATAGDKAEAKTADAKASDSKPAVDAKSDTKSHN
jgi:hypothetical protein